MAQDFYSPDTYLPFFPFGATQPEEELLYPEQGMQFGGTGGSLFGAQPTDGGIDPPTFTAPEVRAGRSQQRQGELDRRKPAVTTTEDEGGFFSPGGFGYEYLGGRLGETIGQFVGEQKYGTGLDVEGEATGRPLNPRGLPGQTATLGASVLELMGDYGIDPVVTAAKVVPEYVTGLDLTDSSLIEAPTTEVQPAAPEIPQGAPGSPQAFFEEYRSKGPLTPEQIARGEEAAARMGTTFDPDLGFSRDPFLAGAKSAPVTPGLVTQSGLTLNEYLNAPSGTEGVSGLRTDPQGRMIPSGFETRADAFGDYERESAAREGRLAARMQQPGETITERDTRLAGERTTGPRTYGGYTTAQLRDVVGGGDALRAAQMQAEMEGKQTEREQYDNALKTKILEERLRGYLQEDPDRFEEARVLIEKMIQAKQIAPQDGNQYMLRALNLDKRSFDEGGESDLVKLILGAGDGSEGNAGGSQGRSDIPQAAIDALRDDPSRASEFDQHYGQGSSSQFL